MSTLCKNLPFECEDPLLNIRAVASYLNISVSTATKLSASRVIPVFKPSSKIVLYRKSDIDSWLEKSRIERKSTVEEKASEFLFTNFNKQSHENHN